jgi:type II secretory pathway component PulM
MPILTIHREKMMTNFKRPSLPSSNPLAKMIFFVTLGSFIVALAWYFILKPIQNRLENRIKLYPTHLAYLQDLNKNLLLYKSRSVAKLQSNEIDFSDFKKSLASQGLQFDEITLESPSPTKIHLVISEIEFSRWLQLVEDLRKKNGLFVDQLVITKTNAIGIVQVSATLVQVP